MATLQPELRTTLARLAADLNELTRALNNSSNAAPFAPVSDHSKRHQHVLPQRRFSFAPNLDQAESEDGEGDYPFADEREKILRQTLPDEDRLKELRDAFLLRILDERPEADREQGGKSRAKAGKAGKRPGKQKSDGTEDTPQLVDWFNSATIQVDCGSSRSPRKLVIVLTSKPWTSDQAGPQDPVNTPRALGSTETAVRREMVKKIRNIWPKTLGSGPTPAKEASAGSDNDTVKERSDTKDNDEAEDSDENYEDDENAFWQLDALPEQICGTHFTVKAPKPGEEAKPPTDLGTYEPPRIDMLPAQGRLWEIVIPHDEFVLSFEALAFILSIFHSDTLNDSRVAFVARFVERHWKPDLPSCMWGSRPLHNDWRFNIQFYLRGCDAVLPQRPESSSESKTPRKKTQDGLWLHRETGFIQGPTGKSATFTENRVCISIHGYEFGSNASTYTILTLSDAANHWVWDDLRTEASQWQNYGLKPSGTDPAVDHFLATLCNAVSRWERLWNTALDQLDEVLRVRMGDTLDENFIRELMFDDSFTRSELYFKTLQLLRTFPEWMSDSLASLDYLRHYFLPHMRELAEIGLGEDDDDDEEGEAEEEGEKGGTSDASGSQNSSNVSQRLTLEDKSTMEANWAAASDFLKAAEARLQERVSRKTEEVKSLRDGLFNATSLREATRGLRLNQYILVFTIMTIFYLPLSFVATLFGMHLFDYDDTAKTQQSFYITMAVAAVITYVMSGVLLWRISPQHSKDQLRLLFRRRPKGESPPSPPTSPKGAKNEEKRKKPRPPSRKAPNTSRSHAPSASSLSGYQHHSTARSRRQSSRSNPRSSKFSARRRGTQSEMDLEAGESSVMKEEAQTRSSHKHR